MILVAGVAFWLEIKERSSDTDAENVTLHHLYFKIY